MFFSLIFSLFLCNYQKLLLRFCSLPLVKKVPKRVQILFFCIARIICFFILLKIAFALGYLLMDELQRALDQFYRPSAGGMSGEFNIPPGPSEGGSVVAFSSENHNEPAPSAYEGQGGSFYSQIEPLLSDAQRRMELEQELGRLIENEVIPSPSPSERSKLLNMQFECELKLEEALRSDGFHDEKILSCRNDWRRAAFFPTSRPTPISSRAMRQTMAKHTDIRQTLYYRRIIHEINQGVIHMN